MDHIKTAKPRFQATRSICLLLGASMTTLTWCGPALAQQSEPPTRSDTDRPKPETEIVVTGTRIIRDGYEAPTPVTVVPIENLLKAAPTSLANALVQLPQFAGSATPSSQNTFVTNSVRPGTVLSLRGLGPERTLTLQDGFRLPSTELSGAVNIEIIPQALVERVDIVTSGASATYGSDAVAGVVNIITRKKFTGVKLEAQAGISTYDDNENFRISGTAGLPIGERGHIVLNAMHYKSEGFRKNERPYLTAGIDAVGSVLGTAAAPGSAGNPLIDVVGGVANQWTEGGLITSVGLPQSYPTSVVGLTFLQGGAFRQVNRGTPTGTTGHFTGPSDYVTFDADGTQGTPTRTNQVFGRASYDLTDDIEIYAQGTYTRSRINSVAHEAFIFPFLGAAIFSENAFLPAALHNAGLDSSADNAIPAFYITKLFQDRPNTGGLTKASNYTARVGLDGTTAGFDWHAAYQRGTSKSNTTGTRAVDQLRLNAALDAVRDPQGNIVCRVLLNPDPAIRGRYQGCVPLNPFGPNAESTAAFDYITGNPPHRITKLKFESVAASASRELFDLWAGPLSVAAGGEYRKMSLVEIGDFDPSLRQDLTGLRGGIAVPSRHIQGDTGNSRGAYTIKEAFAEVDLPLLKDFALARSLDVNGAVRVTDYSTSGTVTTWKIGGTWVPIEDLRFRITRSRDIRAPSLYETFQGSSVTQIQVLDVHLNPSANTNPALVGGGNPNLTPEIADTLSFGFSAAPSFIPNFRFSVDYFKVKIADAIQAINPATMLRECELSNGTAPVCASIIRPLPFSDRSPANAVTRLLSGPVNIGRFVTEGLDVDASYATELGNGRLSARLIANFIFSQKRQASPSQAVIESAGFTEGGIPKVRGNLQVSYDLANFGIFVQERMIGKLKRGPILVWAEPSLPTVFYTDATLTYRFGGEEKQQAFFTVNNIFNRKAPIIGIQNTPNVAIATLPNVYDVVGRMFTAGVRVSF